MKAGKLALAFAGIVAVATALSGCVLFKGPATVKQVAKKPKATVAFTICRAGSEGSICPEYTNIGNRPHRVLIGLRVPKGTKTPASFAPKAIKSETYEGKLTFSREPYYSLELNKKAPRGTEFKYFGYASDQGISDPQVAFNDTARFKIPLVVPERLVGKRFGVAPVVGLYRVTEEQPIDAPVLCGEDPFGGGTYGGENSGMDRCIDYPAKEDLRNVSVRIKPRR